jgi:hypothetical protein
MNSFKSQKAQNNVTDYIKDNISIEQVVQKLNLSGLRKAGRRLEGNCPTNHSSQSQTCFKIFTDTNS